MGSSSCAIFLFPVLLFVCSAQAVNGEVALAIVPDPVSKWPTLL
ncbi:hypothetical protein D918_03804 [Trichuris suis]|nr:hypothetical protein D918_03804 [Trichuris suis]